MAPSLGGKWRKGMTYLKRSLEAWGKDDFNRVFQAEVEALPAATLPLQAGLAHSSAVVDEPFRVVALGSEEQPKGLRVKAGIFYSGMIAGCNCADDPTPMETQQEYCELEFVIERQTARATVRLLAEE